jgi:hypothetical protein
MASLEQVKKIHHQRAVLRRTDGDKATKVLYDGYHHGASVNQRFGHFARMGV